MFEQLGPRIDDGLNVSDSRIRSGATTCCKKILEALYLIQWPLHDLVFVTSTPPPPPPPPPPLLVKAFRDNIFCKLVVGATLLVNV